MIMLLRHKKLAGFTLIELVIVLAVASLLFAGLWRLLSGANQQNRLNSDQQTITNLIQSFHRGLGSAQGKTFLTNLYNKYGPGTNIRINLPVAGTNATLAGCQGAGNGNFADVAPLGAVPAALPEPLYFMCLFLDRGIDVNTATSFNQNFRIVIQNPADDGDPNTAIPPYVGSQYTLVVSTTGGDPVPDTSGGQLASMIGGSGGFIYNDTNVCGAPSTDFACGAYGSWSVVTADFGIAGEGGHVFTRSSPPSQSQNDIWLARKPFVSGLTVPATGQDDFHSLQANTFMDGTASFNMEGSELFLGRAGAGRFSTIWGPNSSVGTAGLVDPNNAASEITNVARIQVGNRNDNSNPTLIVNGPNGPADALISDPTKFYRASCGTGAAGPSALDNCAFIALFNGNVRTSGMLYANFLYANSFVYDTSDIRLKKDIKPLNNVLDKLSQVKGMSFIKPNDTKTSFGVLAQDVEKVYPELVYTIGDGYKAVDYIGMIGPLVAAVNELRDQNIALRKIIEDNKTRIEELEKKDRKL